MLFVVVDWIQGRENSFSFYLQYVVAGSADLDFPPAEVLFVSSDSILHVIDLVEFPCSSLSWVGKVCPKVLRVICFDL
jgi:hypothetical protein